MRERIQDKKKTNTRTLVFTSDPANTDIPIILADAIYNLRAALDHLIMSPLVPSKQARERHVPDLPAGCLRTAR